MQDEFVIRSSENWKLSTCMPLKYMLTEHQDPLLSPYMAKKYVNGSNQNIK